MGWFFKKKDKKLVIATRKSKLALWQAKHVKKALEKLYPDTDVQLLELSTRGDEILDRTLSKVGGKGLFIKELEVALLDGRADLAVHSLKDMSTTLEPEFELTAIMEREDPRDCWISGHHEHFKELADGGIVGTSSLRREMQIHHACPTVDVRSVRGNLQTRLDKLENMEYDALVLAAAGIKRMGLAHTVRTYFDVEEMVPAVGQGALGLEILASRDDVRALLAPLNHPETAACCRAERALSKVLGGSCLIPLAAHARLIDGQLHMLARVGLPDGSRMIEATGTGSLDQPEALGEAVAQKLIDQGAQEILQCLLS